MQPCFEQEKHQYHESRLEYWKESIFYEMLPAGPVVYIPNGGLDLIWDATICQQQILTCKSGILQLDWKGHSILGIHLDKSDDYFYEDKQVEMFWREMHMLCSSMERITFCKKNLSHMIGRKSRHPVLLYGMQQMNAANGCIVIEEIANERGYSARQFERIFKAYLNITPKQYSQYCRLTGAIEKMKDSDFESFRQLSSMLGYSDSSHFQREFKRFFHITPKEFKALYL